MTLVFAVFNATNMGFWQILGPVTATVNNLHIPARMLSRVGAHDEFWPFVALPIGQLSAPVLAAAFGTGTVAVTGGAIAAAAMLSASLVPSLQRIEIK